MAMTPLPTPPSRQDPANFAERGDAFLAALPGFVTEANALQQDVTTKQTAASTAATTATEKAQNASDYATTASQAKTAAEAARDTAQTHRNAAEAAKTGAETARDDAEGFAASAAASSVGFDRVKGLQGKVNAALPLIKYDLSADAVTLRNASGATVTRYNTGWLACDLSVAGPAANGRDQAGAFVANSWVNLFFIWDGATLALIASTASHTTGPALPAGYTHWAYATTIRWNASSNIISGVARGARFYYDAGQNILSAGRQTAYTAVSAASFVPSNALSAHIKCGLAATHSSVAQFNLTTRRTGFTSGGQTVATVVTMVAGGGDVDYNNVEMALSASQQFDYVLSAVPSDPGAGAIFDVLGYTLPNGGE